MNPGGNLRYLELIAANKSDRDIFNNNFINARVITGTDITRKKRFGDYGTLDIDEVCEEIGRAFETIKFACYTRDILHLVFEFEDTHLCYTIKPVGDRWTHSFLNDNTKIWGRLQNFFYVDIAHLVSHAKKAPVSKDGRKTLDQIMSGYSNRRTLS